MEKTYVVAKYKISYVREQDKGTLEKRKVSNKNDVFELAKKYLEDLPYEAVIIIALDNQNRTIGINVTEGSVNQCAVYPANVFRFLLSCGAASFVMAHNHPGGNPAPSEADWNITKRLQGVGKGLEVPLLDHIIIAEDDLKVSLREHTSNRWNRE